ncbi:hypothetical protein HYH02_000846 [Chlamydomonas schloesseri]|uniref:SET domain-containing protein n=1 Tax=Chlamydomonas schloesseri TaxID=2026947 RepID=A0A835WWL0_9CHLO|nr:hypothetical protein HYH02_000846 [Chlamydomonas schloesseri]|eukprot:KAG2455021.1 hypothetical protein HYH02_000846 [Chlamydomonas schloesseri]
MCSLFPSAQSSSTGLTQGPQGHRTPRPCRAAATGRPGPNDGPAAPGNGDSRDHGGSSGSSRGTSAAAACGGGGGCSRGGALRGAGWSSRASDDSTTATNSNGSSQFLPYVLSLPAHPPALLLSCRGHEDLEGFEYPPLERAVLSYRKLTEQQYHACGGAAALAGASLDQFRWALAVVGSRCLATSVLMLALLDASAATTDSSALGSSTSGSSTANRDAQPPAFTMTLSSTSPGPAPAAAAASRAADGGDGSAAEEAPTDDSGSLPLTLMLLQAAAAVALPPQAAAATDAGGGGAPTTGATGQQGGSSSAVGPAAATAGGLAAAAAATAGGELRMLVPLLDMMNHRMDRRVGGRFGCSGGSGSNSAGGGRGCSGGDEGEVWLVSEANVRWEMRPPSGAAAGQGGGTGEGGCWRVAVVATADLRPGDELLLCYDQAGSNDAFALHYGFLPPFSPHDDVQLFEDAAHAVGWWRQWRRRQGQECQEQQQQQHAEEEEGGGVAPDAERVDAEPLKLYPEGRVCPRLTAALSRAPASEAAADAAAGVQATAVAVAARCEELLAQRRPLLDDLRVLAADSAPTAAACPAEPAGAFSMRGDGAGTAGAGAGAGAGAVVRQSGNAEAATILPLSEVESWAALLAHYERQLAHRPAALQQLAGLQPAAAAATAAVAEQGGAGATASGAAAATATLNGVSAATAAAATLAAEALPPLTPLQQLALSCIGGEPAFAARQLQQQGGFTEEVEFEWSAAAPKGVSIAPVSGNGLGQGATAVQSGDASGTSFTQSPHTLTFAPSPATRRNAPSTLDHVKHLQFRQATATRAGSKTVMSIRMSSQTFLPTKLPYAVVDPQDDIRLGSCSQNFIDFNQMLVADMFLTNTGVWALYERLPFVREFLGRDYAAFTFVKRVGDRKPGDENLLQVKYDKSANTLEWWVDGALKLKVDRIGYKPDPALGMVVGLDLGGAEEEIRLDALQAGFGCFTLLDFSDPTGRGRDGLLNLNPTASGLQQDEVYFFPKTFQVDTRTNASAIGDASWRLFGQSTSMRVSYIKVAYETATFAARQLQQARQQGGFTEEVEFEWSAAAPKGVSIAPVLSETGTSLTQPFSWWNGIGGGATDVQSGSSATAFTQNPHTLTVAPSPATRLSSLGTLDHVKHLQFRQATATRAGSKTVMSIRMSSQTFLPAALPYAVSNPQDDIRLGSCSQNFIDFSQMLVADMFLTNTGVWALYERLPFARTADKVYAAFTYVKKIADRKPGDENLLQVKYDKSANTLEWWVDGALKLKVDRIGYKPHPALGMVVGLDLGGAEEEIRLDALQAGFGCFTLLDFSDPTGRGRDGLLNSNPTSSGQQRDEVYFFPKTFQVDTRTNASAIGDASWRLFGQGTSMTVSYIKVAYETASA